MKSIDTYIAKKQGQFSYITYCLSILALLILGSFIFGQNAEAQQLVCPERFVEQLTDTPTGFNENPSINADGMFIAFDSTSNINGGNPDGNKEIYLVNTRTENFTQITDTGGGATNSSPSIDAGATRIAFHSNANIGGGNPDGSTEIYFFDIAAGTFTQVTDTMAGTFSLAPSINANGTRIAFESDGNINGLNPDGNREIWLFDTVGGTITQITDTIGDFSANAAINGAGTLVAFRSNGNFGGGNPGGVGQIWLFNSTTSTITQQTSGPIESGGPRINADGTVIGFRTAANINGGNPEGNLEAFFIEIASGVITQITKEPTGTSTVNSVNADGSLFALNSEANINGGNPEGNNEIYIFERSTGIITQVTDQVTGESFDAEINADGTHIAFSSDAFGNPVDNFEIFLARCFDPMTARNIPTLSQWGLIAMAGVLGIIGIMAVRRRKAAM
jgi:Tol biopolymer transport system component